MQSAKCRVRSENDVVRNEANRLRQVAPRCAALRRVAPRCATLRHVAPRCATLRESARAERSHGSSCQWSVVGCQQTRVRHVRNEPILLHGVAWRCITLHGVAYGCTRQCAKRTHREQWSGVGCRLSEGADPMCETKPMRSQGVKVTGFGGSKGGRPTHFLAPCHLLP